MSTVKRENFTEVSREIKPRTGTNIGKPIKTLPSEKTVPVKTVPVKSNK